MALPGRPALCALKGREAMRKCCRQRRRRGPVSGMEADPSPPRRPPVPQLPGLAVLCFHRSWMAGRDSRAPQGPSLTPVLSFLRVWELETSVALCLHLVLKSGLLGFPSHRTCQLPTRRKCDPFLQSGRGPGAPAHQCEEQMMVAAHFLCPNLVFEVCEIPRDSFLFLEVALLGCCLGSL